jgi:hypothetical protein
MAPHLPARHEPLMPYEWPERPRFSRMLMRLLEKITTTTNNHTFDEFIYGIPVDDTIPTNTVSESFRATSSDGEQLLIYLQGGLSWPWAKDDGLGLSKKMKDAADELAKDFAPPAPKPKDVRHFNFEALAATHGRDCGVYHFALWVATGQANVANPRTLHNAVLSHDIVNTAYKTDKATAFFEQITPLIQTIGILFEGIDTETYNKYKNNYNYLADNTPLKLLRVSKRSCFLGLAVLRNLQAEPHKDVSDAKDG